MGAILDEAQTVYADGPSGSPTQPAKSLIRHLFGTIDTRVDAALAGTGDIQGTWDASSGTFPGSGTADTGATWLVTTAGTTGGVAFRVGDRIISVTTNSSTSTYAGNWLRLPGNLDPVVEAVDSGAGTANAIQVVASKPVSADGGQLVSFEVYEANTSNAVTLQITDIGGAVISGLAMKTATGANPEVGTVDGRVLGQIDGSTFILIFDASVHVAVEKARKWADNDVDVEVEPGKYSARHHAERAHEAEAAAVAASEAAGVSAFFDTYADAETALAGLSDGQVVEVFEDEEQSGSNTRYRVESSVLVLKQIFGSARFANTTTNMASMGNVVPLVEAVKAYTDTMVASVSTREFVVTDPAYGADPDDPDTRDAINAAIAAANAAGGGVVRLPPGTFTVVRGADSTLGIILMSNVHLRGAAQGLTTIKAADGTSVMHLIGDPTGEIINCGLFDLTVDGNGQNFSGTGLSGSHAIRIASFNGFFLQNVTIKNADHHGFATLNEGAATGFENRNLFIDNVYLENIGTGGWQGGDGLRVFYAMRNCVINNVQGNGIEYHGIHIAKGACVLNNVVLYNVGNAALSPQSDGCMVNNLHIEWEDGYVVNDLFANRPAAGVPGRFFRASDTGTVYRDNGVAWKEAAANFSGVWAITRGGFPTGGKSSYSNVKIVFRVTENVAWSPAYGDGFRLDVPHAMANNIQVYGKFRFGIYTTDGNNTIDNSVVDGAREDGYRIAGNDNTIEKWKVVTANLSAGANYAVRLTGQRSQVLNGRNLDGTNIVTDIAETGTADANIIAGNHLAGSGDRMLMIGANSKHYGNIGLSYDYADISDTVAPADTNLNVLKSRTLRTSELPLGKELEVFVSGTMSGSAATRTLKMYFGGQEFNISVQAVSEAQDWAGWMRIRRLTSTTAYWIQTSGQEENGNNTPAGGRYSISANSAVGVKVQKVDAADAVTCNALIIKAVA